jgi:hypothetical protein
LLPLFILVIVEEQVELRKEMMGEFGIQDLAV